MLTGQLTEFENSLVHGPFRRWEKVKVVNQSADTRISSKLPSKWTLNKEHLKMCEFKWVLTNHGIAE